MAATSAICALRGSAKIYPLCRAAVLSRLLSGSTKNANKTLVKESTTEDEHSPRDPLAVLKALASTVEPTALAPPKELYEDVLLLPRTPRKREECKAAMMSGRKAAEFVISRYPQLFPMRKPEPAWPRPDPQVLDIQEEDDLKSLITQMKPQEAIEAYEKLLELGVAISLETQNDLLDLVAFFGVSNIATEEVEKASEESSSSSSSESSDEMESSDDEPEVILKDRYENTWSMDNYAEQLFSKMETKNGRTYEAMILALFKHNNYKRAFELYEEMRQQGFQANVNTYAVLFTKSMDQYGRGQKLWEGIERLIGEMKKAPAVKPNLVVYNEILKMCGFVPDGTDKAMMVFRDLYDKGIEPSLGSYSLLIRAEYYLKRTRAVDEGIDPSTIDLPNNTLLQNIITHLESLPAFPEMQSYSDVKFFNTAIGAALYCRDANAAHRLLALAHTNPTKYLGPKRGQFYATFLATLARSEENPELTYRMYKELVPSKLLPQPWVYAELLRMAEKARLPRLVPRFYDDMKRYRTPLEQSVCRGIFSALSRKTEVKHYKEYVDIMTDVFFWMNRFNIPVDGFMISQLVRQHSTVGQIEQAWKAFEMFDELKLVPTYTALTGLLQCCKLRKDARQAVRVFEMMAENGYGIHMRKRSDVFEATQMQLAERVRINKLFEDFSKLDDQRTAIRNQHMLKKSREEEPIDGSSV